MDTKEITEACNTIRYTYWGWDTKDKDVCFPD
jgi:hypothetical protein